MARTRRYNNNRQSNNRGGGGGNDRRHKHNAVKAVERYLNMAKDAASNGDVHLAENYYQHSDHYYRIAYADEIQRAANNDEPQDDDIDDNEDEAAENEPQVDQRHQRPPRGRRPQRKPADHQDQDDEAPKRRTRRPVRANDRANDGGADDSADINETEVKSPRGRRPSKPSSDNHDDAPDIDGVAFLQKPVLSGGGSAPAPLNAPQPELSLNADKPANDAAEAVAEPVKRKRGRPRKNPLPEAAEDNKPQAAAE